MELRSYGKREDAEGEGRENAGMRVEAVYRAAERGGRWPRRRRLGGGGGDGGGGGGGGDGGGGDVVPRERASETARVAGTRAGERGRKRKEEGRHIGAAGENRGGKKTYP